MKQNLIKILRLQVKLLEFIVDVLVLLVHTAPLLDHGLEPDQLQNQFVMETNLP